MIRRMGNTAREIVAAGDFVKVGRKHYRHVGGAEIVYDCNAWQWKITGRKGGWDVLWPAVHEVRRAANGEAS